MEIYQVDAFADALFTGNPAAVVPLESWPNDELLQNIAAENNLAETAFYIPKGDAFELRWFTPKSEVDLCGHATLATAHVLFFEKGFIGDELNFQSLNSGSLSVRRNQDKLTLNFPKDVISKLKLEDSFLQLTNHQPIEVWQGKTDWILVFETEDEIRSIKVNEEKLKIMGGRGLIATSVGMESDFVSRFFAPQVGISEDPVTGSAHTSLAPLWAEKLNKTDFFAIQRSSRGGKLWCTILGNRVEITGTTKLYLKGNLNL